MAQDECRTPGCERVGQIEGWIKGFCCSRCNVLEPGRHAIACNMIERVGNAELELGDNIVLGYN